LSAGFCRLAARPSVIVSFSLVLPVGAGGGLMTSLPALLKPEVALSPLLVSLSLDVDAQLSVRAG